MGCDIHMYVEYKKEMPIKGVQQQKWVSGDYFKHNPYKGIDYDDEFFRIELYGNRNYALFATLAGVRDYSEPKGMPDDCCEFVKKECDGWDIDGHTHSWLTLKEIKDYQAKSPTFQTSGLINPEAVIEFDKNGTIPKAWCQYTNMEGWERRNWSEPNETLLPLIELLQQRAHELLQYKWHEYDTANDENIRIVFWFDN
jgi:hypothetical protein